MNSMYQKASSYAYHINPHLYRDIIHDAYLVWYDKTKTNLFEQHERTVMSVVKKVWYNKYFHPTRFVHKGTKHKREFVGFVDSHRHHTTTPEDEYIAKEFEGRFLRYEEVHEILSNFELRHGNHKLYVKIYNLAAAGYNQPEIASIVGCSQPSVNNYFKRMRYVASILN